MNKTYIVTDKADFTDLLETLNAVSDKASLEARGITTSILEDRLFYVRDMTKVIPSKIMSDIRNEEGYVIAEYDSKQKCIGLIIKTKSDNIYLKIKDSTAFYNEHYLQEDREIIYICDNPLTTVSIENNSESAVYISESQQKEFIRHMKKNNHFTSFIITSDKLEEVSKSLSKMGIINERYIFDEKCILDDDAVIKNVMECQSIISQKKLEYGLEYSAFGNLERFKEHIQNSRNKNVYSTSFKNFDDLLDGGIRTGLTFVGAISSLGKTTFALQMADQFARNGYDVMIFSLEMSKYELMAKSISRETYDFTHTSKDYIKYAKTTNDILDSRINETDIKEQGVILHTYSEYSRYADNIYIFEGMGNMSVEQISHHVRQHIQYRKKKPIVIIDYLQILKPENAHMSDKQAVDSNVTKLKQLSRDNDIPVLAISSFNRENYHSPVSMMSFKESGSIEYSSDIMIALQYEGMDYKDDEKGEKRETRIRQLLSENNDKKKNGEPIEIQLKVLKNRNGSIGSTNFKFVAKYNYFEEIENKEDSWK